VQSVGRNSAEHLAFERQLLTSHRMRVRVKLQDLDGEELADLTAQLLDGQVNIDASAEVTRSAELTLDDPEHALHLDSDAPAEGGLFLDRMVQVFYGVLVEELGRWVEVSIFRGPVVGMERDGDSISLSCLGKEHLAKGATWRPLTLRKGMDTVAAIKTILRERAGEEDFSFPARGGKLDDQLSLGRLTQPWSTAQELARSINRQLFYDGAGVCQLRRAPKSNAWTFRDGDGGSVLTPPEVSYDLSSVRNLVWVRGKKAKGKPQVSATATPSGSHPLSAQRLGRKITQGGKEVRVPRYLVEVVENDKVRSKKDARRIASSRLQSLLREGVEVSFDSLPIPHLDPFDPVRLATSEVSLSFTLLQASIPLVHSGVMSVGTNKRVTPNRKRIRSR